MCSCSDCLPITDLEPKASLTTVLSLPVSSIKVTVNLHLAQATGPCVSQAPSCPLCTVFSLALVYLLKN